MSKSIKLQDDTFLDSTGIVHNKELLSEVLEDLRKAYPIGSTYINDTDTNPSEILGYGSWEKVRTLYGGELIGFASVLATEGSLVTKNTYVGFGASATGTKAHDITNYINGVLSSGNGAIKVQTKGIVGMVEAYCSVSGQGSTDTVGIWFRGNNNALPENVTLLPRDNSNGLMTGPHGVNYGGAMHNYIYKVDGEDDVTFYVNPQFSPYGGDMKLAISGTSCFLLVKAYAKYGTSYMWKRTA